jgi:hypothetical protein
MTAPLTVFAPDPVGTDTTGETYRVSNGDFLRAVFGEAMADALTEVRPVLVSFAGNPANKPARVRFAVGGGCRSVHRATRQRQQLLQPGVAALQMTAARMPGPVAASERRNRTPPCISATPTHA